MCVCVWMCVYVTICISLGACVRVWWVCWTEETNGSVMMYSAFSIGVMLIVALWQVSHLNTFLKRVKVV